jgi:hypothetical protein
MTINSKIKILAADANIAIVVLGWVKQEEVACKMHLGG